MTVVESRVQRHFRRTTRAKSSKALQTVFARHKALTRAADIEDSEAIFKYLAAAFALDGDPMAPSTLAEGCRIATDTNMEAERICQSLLTAMRGQGIDTELMLRGNGLALPAPKPQTPCWSSKRLWIEGVLHDDEFLEDKRVKQVGWLVREEIVGVLASFADGRTGRAVTASIRRIATEAAAAANRRIKLGKVVVPQGKKKPRLVTTSTVVSYVKKLLAALRDCGWMIVRATGRHLTAVERLLAASPACGAEYQTRAASVRDLIMRPMRNKEPKPTEDTRVFPPAWAAQGSRFVPGQYKSNPDSSQLDHPYLASSQVDKTSSSHWLLTRKSTEKQSSNPSLESQRIAAWIAQDMPQLLKVKRARLGAVKFEHQLHLWTIARQVDQLGLVEDGWTAKLLKQTWNLLMAQSIKEFHFESIRKPIPWLVASLRNLGKGVV